MGSSNNLLLLPLLLVSVLFCSLDGGEGAVKGYSRPPDCKSYECAPYQVVHSQKDFEIRTYKKVTWMSTKPINSSTYKEASDIGFNYLFAYIQGKNAQGAKIDMTAPVFIDVAPSTGPFCNSTFVVHFYVPSKYQRNPPASNEVYPTTLPTRTYAAVRRFGGFMDDTTIGVNAAALKRSLSGTPWASPVAASAKGNKYAYTIAGYNSPFEYQNRVNEVIFWFDY